MTPKRRRTILPGICLVGGVLALAVVTMALAADEAQPYPFEIKVLPAENRELRFELQNNGPQEIMVVSLDLPWAMAWPLAAKITVYGRAPNNRLEKLEVFTDTPVARAPKITIPPGESLSGEIPLRNWVHKWYPERYVDYLVIWVYSLNLCDQNQHLLSTGVATVRGEDVEIIKQETIHNLYEPTCRSQS